MENKKMETVWREACGPTPGPFRTAALRGMAAAGQARRGLRPRPVLAAALALMLMAGGAFALQSLGLLDLMSPTLKKDMLPAARQLVNGRIAQQAAQTKLASFKVEEAVYDGHQVYVSLRVSPADNKVLLMDQQAEAAWAADWQATGDPYSGESFDEKARAAGQQLTQAEVGEVTVNGVRQDVNHLDAVYEDGDIRYTLSLPAGKQRAI